MTHNSMALLNGDVPGLPLHAICPKNTAIYICFLMWDSATLYKTFNWKPSWLVLRMIEGRFCGHIHGCVLGEQMLFEDQACASSLKLPNFLLGPFPNSCPK